MTEGWHNDDYLILLDQYESKEKERLYDFGRLIPNHRLIGYLGWDDFIVEDASSRLTFRVPTIPLIEEYKKEWNGLSEIKDLEPDERFKGKIKWYVKPLIFGGDPSSQENTIWITHKDHIDLVKYWNNMYHEIKETK